MVKIHFGKAFSIANSAVTIAGYKKMVFFSINRCIVNLAFPRESQMKQVITFIFMFALSGFAMAEDDTIVAKESTKGDACATPDWSAEKKMHV